MRRNEPVTKTEFVVTDEMLLVSKTDTKGRITFVNEAFLAAHLIAKHAHQSVSIPGPGIETRLRFRTGLAVKPFLLQRH